MFTIAQEVENELLIKKSRFITILYRLDKKEDVALFLEKTKRKYPKATHYTYAYRLNNSEKVSDDKEPSGTAGLPILTILQKEQMTNILVVVVRYFGGVKLGAAGLIRAYSSSCKEALKKVEYRKLIPGFKVKVTLDYNQEKNFISYLEDSQILQKKYAEKIEYLLIMKDPSKLDQKFTYEIIEQNKLEEKYIN